MKQKTIIVSLVLFFLFFIGLEIVTTATEERSLVDACENTGFVIDQMVIENWVPLDIDESLDPEKLLLDISEKVGLKQPYRIRKSGQSKDYTYVLTKQAMDVSTIISLRHVNEVIKGSKKRYYVRVQYILDDKFSAGEQLRMDTKKILEGYGNTPNSNISCQGYYPGNLFTEGKSQRKLQELETFFGIRFQKELTQPNLISAYGYSWRFNDFILLKGKKVSIELRMDYDEARNSTKLIMGLPVINLDY